MFFFISVADGEAITHNGIIYDTETVAELITVITSTSPVQSMPSPKHLYPSQQSLFQIPAFARCKKIIVFDGIRQEQMHLKSKYDEYKKNIANLTQTDPNFSNTQLVFCNEWKHLTGSLYEAMKHVSTPFVYIHQHDLQIVQDFDLNGLIATMVANPSIQCVMLANTDNLETGEAHPYHGYVDRKISGECFVPLTRCFGWSDQAQIATKEYYENVVFPQCLARKGSFMEQTMLIRIRYDVEILGKDVAHPIYACYLYGGPYDGIFISHSDGRNN